MIQSTSTDCLRITKLFSLADGSIRQVYATSIGTKTYNLSKLFIDSLNDGRGQDLILEDGIGDGKEVVIGEGADFRVSDTALAILYSLTEEHYRYLLTLSSAQGALGNPFAQPVSLEGNIEGGVGIFTSLTADSLFRVRIR